MEDGVAVPESEPFLAAPGACLWGPDRPDEVVMPVKIHILPLRGGAALALTRSF